MSRSACEARICSFVRLLALAWLALALPAWAATPWLERAPGTELRVLVWNVSREAVLEQPDGFRRVLAAVDADVLVLDEMPSNTSAEAIAALLPAGTTDWQVHYGIGGGSHQRVALAARVPMQPVAAFDQLAYPAGAAASWARDLPPEYAARFRANLEAGVAAAGAVLTLGERKLLVVGADLQCCGKDAKDWPEARRRHEASALRAAIDQEVAARPVSAVIFGGDLNPVTGPRPVQLLRGTEATTMPLADVPARHRGSDADWTWDGRGTPFPNGRLDYLMHSPALQPLQAQLFDTGDLDADTLAALGLDAALSHRLSEHRPIVVDFAWR